MRVERTDVYFLLRAVCKAAADLIDHSEPLGTTTTAVQTAQVQALRRSLDDLLAMGQAYQQGE